MVPRLSLLFVALTSVLAVVTEFTNTTPHETKRPCPAIWDTAIVRSAQTQLPPPRTENLLSRSQSVTTELQATQFNSSLGYYRGNRLWTDAVSFSLHCTTTDVDSVVPHFQNTIEDIYNLMSLRNVNTWRDLIYQTPIGHMNLWDFYFNGSFDDAGVGHDLNAPACWRSDGGRSTHTVGVALVYPHTRLRGTNKRRLSEIRGTDEPSTSRALGS